MRRGGVGEEEGSGDDVWEATRLVAFHTPAVQVFFYIFLCLIEGWIERGFHARPRDHLDTRGVRISEIVVTQPRCYCCGSDEVSDTGIFAQIRVRVLMDKI